MHFWHPPLDWNQGVPLFMWLEQDLPRILTDSLEPCHFHQLNGFHEPLPFLRHMLWPSPSALWLKHLSYIYDLQGSAMPLNTLYINWMTLSRIFWNFLWQSWRTFCKKFLSNYYFIKQVTYLIIIHIFPLSKKTLSGLSYYFFIACNSSIEAFFISSSSFSLINLSIFLLYSSVCTFSFNFFL